MFIANTLVGLDAVGVVNLSFVPDAHLVSSPHRLRAYSIGLQVAGVTEDRLRSLMKYVSVSTTVESDRPTATVTLPPGYIAAGGGGLVEFDDDVGLLLTESYSPDGLLKWKVSAKDHGVADRATLSVSLIGLPVTIDDIFLDLQYTPTSAFVNTGYGAASTPLPAGFVPIAVGAQAQYNGGGRLLTRAVPVTPSGGFGAQVVSKDHVYVDSGWTTAYLMSIRKYQP
jgi:vibriolysin